MPASVVATEEENGNQKVEKAEEERGEVIFLVETEKEKDVEKGKKQEEEKEKEKQEDKEKDKAEAEEVPSRLSRLRRGVSCL